MPASRSRNVLSTSVSENTFYSSSARTLTVKTPARSLKRGRAVHDENAIYGHPKTTGHTGRKKLNAAFATPAIEPLLHTQLRVDKVPGTTGKSTALSEITNKTPFRKPLFPVTPLPPSPKPLRSLAISNDNPAIPPARRISSTRKKLRLPTSTGKNFETPESRGDHWDVSDVSIAASSIDEVSETAEDFDDVEYGPPTAIDPQYETPFEMPDYKEVGATLMALFRQHTVMEDYDPTAEVDDTELLAEIGNLEWECLQFPDIPLENIFPSILPEPTLSLRTENRPHPHFARQSTVATSSNSVRPRRIIPLLKTKPTANVRRPPLTRFPDNPASNPVMAHTRIPSLSKVPQVSPLLNQAGKPTGSHSRATSIPHSRVMNSISHPTVASTSHSRTTSLPKTSMLCKNMPKDKLQRPQVNNDTVESLLVGTGDEVLGDDFLFDV